MNRSQTNECGNWDWGRVIPFLGLHKWDFRCSAIFKTTLVKNPGFSIIYLQSTSSYALTSCKEDIPYTVQYLSSFLFDVVNYHVIIYWNICAYMLTSTSKTVAKIHERTISLRFLGTILRVLRLDVSVYNVYVTNQFQTTFALGGGGGGGV